MIPGCGAEHILRCTVQPEEERRALRASGAAVRIRRARADDRRADDADPPRQAPPGLRRQPEQGVGRARSGTAARSSRCSRTSTSLPEDKQAAVRNNGGGHANHSLFWQIMKPGGGGDPSGALGQAIADTFGDADQLKAAINDGGVKRFGSGWTWLVWDGTGLAVYSTREPGQPAPAERRAAPRHRRLGARVLPPLPEPPPRLPRRVVGRRQLGRGRPPLRGGARARRVTSGAS